MYYVMSSGQFFQLLWQLGLPQPFTHDGYSGAIRQGGNKNSPGRVVARWEFLEGLMVEVELLDAQYEAQFEAASD